MRMMSHLPVMLRLAVLLILASLLGCADASGQNFAWQTGRNHPQLDWQVAETEHFEIIYPRHLEGIEAEAAAIAEASYAALSENLGVDVERPIRIYLSDQDEIANGHAVPLGAGYTNIWVHVNETAVVFSGPHGWLRKVIPHELAHIFHYQAVLERPRAWSYLLASPMPGLWAEGLAQYQSEPWDALRGDRWLRIATLEDRLSSGDGESIWNPRLRYAAGNSQVRYFAEQHGDSTLARMLAHRTDRLLGLLRVHDFGRAFEETTGTSYGEFEESWRRHVNIYYNTLAGQVERSDSLEAETLTLPAQYVDDVRLSPDMTQRAVLGVMSLVRPVRRLWVVDRESGEERRLAEGPIHAPLAWSPNSRRLAFARQTRGENGAQLNDLFVVDVEEGQPERLTHSRRAVSPTFAPDGERLAFIASEGETANVYVLDLATGEEEQLTNFTGGVKLLSVQWHPQDEVLALARFLEGERRDIALVDVETGEVMPVTDGEHDDRDPVWARPAGGESPPARLVYTSLRDGVPNLFRYDMPEEVLAGSNPGGTHRRLSHLATGLTAFDWLPPDSLYPEGRIVALSQKTKREDEVFVIDAAREVDVDEPDPPRGYGEWMARRPPRWIPDHIAPDPDLIEGRRAYSSWRNITHAASGALPYYVTPDDWGLLFGTAWTEPLGKHNFGLLGGFSAALPLDRSFFFATYENRQWHPTLSLTAYRTPVFYRRIYGGGLLTEALAGMEAGAALPLDWRQRPYTETAVEARFRLIGVEPTGLDWSGQHEMLPPPEAGQQSDLRLSFTRRTMRPFQGNMIHPLDGTGMRLQLTGAARIFGTDVSFLRADVAAFHILPLIGRHRLYLYGRAQAQEGVGLPQNYLGFSGYPDIQISLPRLGEPITLGGSEYVRGHPRYAIGNRVLFGTVEYRAMLLPSLETRLLGLVSFDGTALALFADAGAVWAGQGRGLVDQRVGLGVELKNAFTLFGFLQVGQAAGVGQPVGDLFMREEAHFYYRLQTAVPF